MQRIISLKDKIDKFFAVNGFHSSARDGNATNHKFEYHVIEYPFLRTVKGIADESNPIMFSVCAYSVGQDLPVAQADIFDIIGLVNWIRTWIPTQFELDSNIDIDDCDDDVYDDIAEDDDVVIDDDADIVDPAAYRRLSQDMVSSWKNKQFAMS